MNLTQEQIESFWSRVDKSGVCWPWTRAKTNGYGSVVFNGKHIGTHRLAYMLTHGPIPEGRLVCHHCDNPVCCNPAHLYAGTPSQNTQDAYDRGRQPPRKKAERQWVYRPRKLKLTNEQVREIRAAYKQGRTLSQLAKQYKVDQSFISRIVNNKVRKAA